MIKFLIDRTILLVLKLFGIATILFFIIQTLPADPAAVAAGPDARPEQIKQIRIDLGLDKPVIIQYFTLNSNPRLVSCGPTFFKYRRN